MKSHTAGFLLLVPAALMICLHRILGLSSALMIETPPGEREAHAFNLALVAVVCFGGVAFATHAFCLMERGRVWIAAKLLVLAICWGGLIICGG